MATTDDAFSYVRFSKPEQSKGDSLRRQTEAAADWCRRHKVHLDTTLTLHDKGVSGYTGAHRSNPDRHALALFLKHVEAGVKVPRGSYLIIENLDRLSREEAVPATHLLTSILMAGVRVVQLFPSELVLTDKSDPFDVMRAVMELSRGNNESATKSRRLREVWAAKRARIGQKKLTPLCPFWLELAPGGASFLRRPERVEVLRRLFRLAREGYGAGAIARLLNADGVPAPRGGTWSNWGVLQVLRSPAVHGAYQPHVGRTGDRKPHGDPVPDYFPCVIPEKEYLAVQDAIAGRKFQRGPCGKRVSNLFTGLLHDARDGSVLNQASNRPGETRLASAAARRGQRGSRFVSFPYAAFERAVLSLLAEVDPHDILNGDQGPDDTAALAGDLALVEAKIAALEAELEDGDVAAVVKVLRRLEARKAELVEKLAEARRKAANPLSESWGEAQSLLAALDAAPDPVQARGRLRGILRRVIETVMVLVVAPRRSTRLAAVQIHFAGGRHRDYLIAYQARSRSVPGGWSACSFAEKGLADTLGLRRAKDVAALERALQRVPLG